MMNSNSKFHKYAYSLLWIPVAIPAIVVGCGVFLLRDESRFAAVLKNSPNVIYLVIATLIIMTGFWIYLFHTRMLQLELSEHSIKARGFYGRGGMKEWLFSDLEGYSLEKHAQKNKDVVEYLTIWKGGKKVFMLVDSYYSNYDDLKSAITSKVKLMGAE